MLRVYRVALFVSALLLALDATTHAAVDCSKPRNCVKIYDPVCGSDGTTYGNECELNAATCTKPDLTLKAKGECSSTAPVSPSPSPSPSASPSASPTTAPPSTTPTTTPSPNTGTCEMACTTIYQPVCGTDGKTYENDCALRLAKCNGASSLAIASQGECRSKEPSTGSGSIGNGAVGGTSSTGGAQTGSNATDKNPVVASPTSAPATKDSAAPTTAVAARSPAAVAAAVAVAVSLCLSVVA